MKKAFLLFLSILILALLVLLLNWSRAVQLYQSVTLFDEDKIVYNFSHMGEIFPTIEIPSTAPVHRFGRSPQSLPETYSYHGEQKSLQQFLESKSTTALVVLKGNDITAENYYLGTTENDFRMSNSVAKSFLSAIFGVAIAEGFIASIDNPVTQYVPELVGSGYDNVAIKDVLEMSSGVLFSEDYGDFNSDFNRFTRLMALGGSFDDFAATLTREREPGTALHYVSIDTHVLGMVLRRATGRSIADYFQEKLWSKLGTEGSAFYITDNHNEPMVLGGLNMTARDYVRFGKMFLDGGVMDGVQVVPEDWVNTSTQSQSSHTTPTDDSPGYGYQWWLPPGADEEYMAVGIYEQFIYVNKKLNVVIVKTSANNNFTDASNTGFWTENTAVFRAIAESLKD